MANEQVIEAFKTAKIKQAEIVDDAFNTEPGPLTPAKCATLVDELGQNNFEALCADLLMPDATEDTLGAYLATSEGAKELFKLRDKFPGPVNKAFTEFLDNSNSGQAKLKPLLDLLTACGVEFRTRGIPYEPGEKAPDIVFMDLKLEGDNVPLNTKVPIQIMGQLRKKYDGINPVVFLMSTLDNALEKHRDDFRRDSELFSTQFESLRKGDLSANLTRVERLLIDMAEIKPYVDEVAGHYRTWDGTITNAKSELLKMLRDMDVPDYMVLRYTIAEYEDVGLGTYMTDLLTEALAYHAEGGPDLGTFVDDLNKWEKKPLPRTRFHPVPVVEQIYKANTLCHPARLAYEKRIGLGPDKGKLRLGDIFLERSANGDPTRAVVVMTPACDLVRMDKEPVNVFLCEGVVTKYNKNEPIKASAGGSTPIVLTYDKGGEDGKVELKIIWNKKLPLTWTPEEIKALAAEVPKWIHAGRMRPIYALELQSVVTSDLRRVGVQPHPIIHQSHVLRVLVKDNNKWVRKYESAADDRTVAAVAIGPKSCVFMINDLFFVQACAKVDEWLGTQSATENNIKSLKALFADSTARSNLRYAVGKPAGKFQIFAPLTAGVNLTGDAKQAANLVGLVRTSDGAEGSIKHGSNASADVPQIVVFSFALFDAPEPAAQA